MQLKLLQKNHKNEYLELINEFTKEPKEITKEDFEKWYDLSFGQNALIYVLLKGDKIVGTGKLLLEYKFNNNLTIAGHVEDVVISKDYRGMGFGQIIVKNLINIGKEKGCYKILLNCNDKYIGFYNKCGFIRKGNEMCIYT